MKSPGCKWLICKWTQVLCYTLDEVAELRPLLKSGIFEGHSSKKSKLEEKKNQFSDYINFYFLTEGLPSCYCEFKFALLTQSRKPQQTRQVKSALRLVVFEGTKSE